MKRNMDLIRQILLKIEQTGDMMHVRDLADPEGDDLPVVAQHVEWLEEGGYLKVEYLLESGAERYADGVILHQTWKACEFLDLARDEQVWDTVKSTIAGRFESTSFELLHSLLTDIARASFSS